MRSFKEPVKALAGVLAVLAFLWGINEVGKFLYEPAKDNILLACEDREDAEGIIETVLLGTSLMHVGMDAVTLGEELGTTCMNLATSAQPASGSYYLLKDVLRKNPVKQVFFAVGVNNFFSESENKSTSAKVRVLKMLESPLNKARFLFAEAQPSEWEVLLFCPARTDNTFDLAYIRRNVEYKLSEDFKERKSYKGAEYTYYGMGSESSDAVFSGEFEGELQSNNVWNRKEIVEENVTYMKKMAKLCQDNGVEFAFVVFPYAEGIAGKQGDLSDMDAYMEELAAETGSRLFNYNVTAYPNIYQIFPDSSYMDAKHLNHTGAVDMARLLATDH